MPSLNHIHTFVKYGKKSYRCFDPECTSIYSKDMLHGKASKCTDCGSEFILTHEDLKRARPKCLKCSNTKEARTFQAAARLFEGLGQKDDIFNQSGRIKEQEAQEEKGFELD